MSVFSRLLAELDVPDATCGFHWIKTVLGHAGSNPNCSDARFAAFLTELVETDGFPKPLPHLRHGAKAGARIERGITHRSKWLKTGVLEWLHGYLPPDAADAIDAAAMRDAASDMDAAAASLQLVGGTDLDPGEAA